MYIKEQKKEIKVNQVVKKTLKKLFNSMGIEIYKSGTLETTLERIIAARMESFVEDFINFYQNKLPDNLLLENNRYRLLSRLVGTGLCEGMHIVNYLNKSLELDGDICEFGVATGATSALMANEICNIDKNLWLFDSFEGLPKPSTEDTLIDDIYALGSMESYQGKMSYPVDEVKQRLKNINFPLSRVKICQGWIEKIIESGNLPAKICFAYVDFDFYQPIKATLEAIGDRLAVNGHVIIDDYGYFSDGCKKAVDEFMNEYGDKFSAEVPDICKDKFIILTKIRN